MSTILEKLEKLIRLGGSNNLHEAERAMEHAQRIAIENNVNLAAFMASGKHAQAVPADAYVRESQNIGKRMPVAQKWVFPILTRFFNVKIVTGGNRNVGRYIYFIGSQENVDFARWASDFLSSAFLEHWQRYQREHGVNTRMRTSFFAGIYKGLSDKLQRQKEEQESKIQNNKEYALVVYNQDQALEKAMRSFFPRLQTKRATVNKIFQGKEMQAGYSLGQKINLNKQLARG